MPAQRKRPRSTNQDGKLDASDVGSSSHSWLTVFQNLFAVDSRSLAAFRIAIGSLLLVDLCIRAFDLNVMYSDSGMFPRSLICRYYNDFWNWSFHFGSGGWEYQAVLFVIAASLAIAVIVGYETRWAILGAWLMLVSVQNRVPPILDGSDNLLRMLIFWGFFLPLDQVWAVGGSLRPHHSATNGTQSSILTVATAAILLQMGLMYLFSAVFKCNPDWMQGETIGGALSHDFYAKPIASSLLSFPGLLKVLTLCVFAVEWAAIFFLFCPKFTSTARLIAIAFLAAMHLGIAIFLNVGLFSYVAIAGLLVFLPPAFWNRFMFARFDRSTESTREQDSLGNSTDVWFYASQVVCAVALLYVCAINVNSLKSQPLAKLGLEQSGLFWSGLGLGQKWNMFDEIPSKDGWYVAAARLRDGKEADLLQDGAPLSWDRPPVPSHMYPNERWGKIFREMAYYDAQGFQVFRKPVAKYLVRNWNAEHSDAQQVDEFEFIYCQETKVDREVAETQRERLLHLEFPANTSLPDSKQ